MQLDDGFVDPDNLFDSVFSISQQVPFQTTETFPADFEAPTTQDIVRTYVSNSELYEISPRAMGFQY